MTKPRKRVILPALVAILLLAAAVCALHWANAVSLRGTAQAGDYTRIGATGETLTLSPPDARDQARSYMLCEDAGMRFGVYMDNPWRDAGVMHISGALLRIDQPVGEVRVRVGLIAEPLAGETAQPSAEVILLNTQLVRETAYAPAGGYDDHCGFHAAVETERLPEGDMLYRVVLVDETEGARRMFETGLTVKPIEGGLAFGRVNLPEEAQGNE